MSNEINHRKNTTTGNIEGFENVSLKKNNDINKIILYIGILLILYLILSK